MGISGGVPAPGSRLEDEFKCGECFGLGYRMEHRKMLDCLSCGGTGHIGVKVEPSPPVEDRKPKGQR